MLNLPMNFWVVPGMELTMLKRLFVVVAWAVLIVPSTSWGLAYTIDAPIVIDVSNNAGSGVTGTINPINAVNGLTPTSAGTYTDWISQDILFVEIVLSGGSASVDQFGIGGAGAFAVGGAFYADGGKQSPNDADEPIISITSSALFNFDHLATSAGNLQASETSTILAASFALGDLPPIGIGPTQILADMASFMISSGTNFSVEALVVPIPEPGTALILGLGLAGLATTRRRA
jgi:hypothetical protein